jgi:surface polysaccharide O-acyltransferase-like enzyme
MKQRISAYDALRILAMLAVIGIHALMTSRGFERSAGIAHFDDAIHFAVPLLVFLSGVLVWGREWKAEPGRYQTFMKRRLTRIGLPYLAWFAFYAVLSYTLPARYPGFLQGVAAAPASVGAFITSLISGNIWYHLYFIPMILTFAALTPLASKALRAFSWAPELVFCVALAFKVFLWPLFGPPLQAILGTDLWSYLVHIVVHLPHMILGGWFAIRFGDLVQTRASASAKMSAVKPAAAGFALRLRLKSLLGACKYPVIILALTGLAVWLEPLWQRISKPLAKIAGLSFGAYFVHPAFLILMQRSVGPIDPSNSYTPWIDPASIVNIFITLVLTSFATAALLDRFRPTRWLIGE